MPSKISIFCLSFSEHLESKQSVWSALSINDVRNAPHANSARGSLVSVCLTLARLRKSNKLVFFFRILNMSSSKLFLAGSIHQSQERFSDISRGRQCSFTSFLAPLCAQTLSIESWTDANNDAFRMKKDYNTVISMRKAMFRHLNKAIIVQFFKGVCNAVMGCHVNDTTLLKDPLKLSFPKVT